MAAYYPDPSLLAQSPPHLYNNQSIQNHSSASVYALPTDSEDEAEVDELDSDSEQGDDVGASASTAGQKKGGKRFGERPPGSSLLPSSRVENILQADGVTGSLTMSKEAVFILSVATEEFIKRMSQAGQRHASALRRTTVNYADMASSTQQYQEFMFLQDTIPEPISLSEALERREAKEKEILEANPAMSSTLQTQPPPATSISQPNGKPKAKSRPATNGKEKTSGSASVSSTKRDHKRRDDRRQPSLDNHIDGADADPVWSASASRGARGKRSDQEEELDDDAVNGASHHRSNDVSWVGTASSPRHTSGSQRSGSRSSYDLPESSTHHEYPSSWPGQYTGPASGFLQDPHGGFGRIAQNPGRTIYSQQHRPENGFR
ncbi:hypothetical protein BV22DRAFT_1030694 [Leucogyrophana mollusca]|uniref:Uncharacterized protein n=1 Tax=Leucogyrophana mollusca TaxID=85980 RepID=A0ACB8BU74_9AGAM|nr:hypothetical protein BV22DRAFT_1030694 [Leucogyrophana mollusca]